MSPRYGLIPFRAQMFRLTVIVVFSCCFDLIRLPKKDFAAGWTLRESVALMSYY